MAPQQIQALEILLATIPELEQRINEELAENPTLELLSGAGEDLVGNPVEEADGGGGEADSDAAAELAERDAALASALQFSHTWRDFADQGEGTHRFTGEDAERRQFMFDSLTAEQGLQEFLQQQLREMDDLDETMVRVCAHVIGSIDETGYLRTHPADIATALQVPMETVHQAIDIVQSFDPPGVGARDPRECLLLQLARQGRTDTLEYKLVDKYLEDVEKNHIPKVAKELHTSTTHIYELLEKIRRLNPYPGSAISDKGITYVYPEIFIEKDESGEWIVRSNRAYTPRVRLAPHYLNMLEDPNIPAETKRYIREKLASSRMLMRAMEQRQSTIERIGEALIHFQKDFLENGVEHMRPLIMSQVADHIGVHETTVSRAIANKYVQTPHGLFPIRHFFSTGYRSDDGEQVSSLAIKQRIQSLIDAEDKAKPLSDQKLARMLKEQGFDVARRTVAKYREELNIPSSHLRRSF